MLSTEGAGGHIGGPRLMPNATQTRVFGPVVGWIPHHHQSGALTTARSPTVHLCMNAGAPSSILRPEFEDLVVVQIPQLLGPLPQTCACLRVEYDPANSLHTSLIMEYHRGLLWWGLLWLFWHCDYRLYFYALPCVK